VARNHAESSLVNIFFGFAGRMERLHRGAGACLVMSSSDMSISMLGALCFQLLDVKCKGVERTAMPLFPMLRRFV
jgi:hypothetical protein